MCIRDSDGTVAEINETLLDAPETINQSPYEAWLIRVKDISSEEDLMNAEEYESFCAAQT